MRVIAPFMLAAAIGCGSERAPLTHSMTGVGGAAGANAHGPGAPDTTGGSPQGGSEVPGMTGGIGGSSGSTNSLGGATGTSGSGGGGIGKGGIGASAGGIAGAAASLGGAGAGATGGVAGGGGATIADLPLKGEILAAMRRANDYFMAKWPDPGEAIVTDQTRPSNIWTRAVYYEGLMALDAVDHDADLVDYAVRWGESHAWGLRNGPSTRSADDQCAGQTYIELYRMNPEPQRIADIGSSLDAMVASSGVADWTWIDAIQMAMPAFAKLGALRADGKYFDKAYALYANTKNAQGASGLYDETDHLWWRDGDFDPPYAEPNGQDCFWSRGNGWVYAALVRVLDAIPTDEPHRTEYVADFRAMSDALAAVQRSDGFWNVNLHDPTHFGGKELTGTALFTYGMAWGVRQGILDAGSFAPKAALAWKAMVADALRPDGSLGYVQGSGKQPSDGQPVTYDSVPDFEDFGLGCFLLAGSESVKLAPP